MNLLISLCLALTLPFSSAFAFSSRPLLMTWRRSVARTTTALESSLGKRGKTTKPPRIRRDYSHEHNAREQRNEGVEAQAPRSDGLPVFNLFVRAHRRQTWKPCGSFTGNQHAAEMVESYADNHDNEALYHKQELDYMVSRALQEDFGNLQAFCRKEYPDLVKKNHEDEFEFGYQIAHHSLPYQKAQKISCVTHTELMP